MEDEAAELPAATRRAELEKFIWQWTEWRGSAEVVDQLLSAVDAYADARCRENHGVTPRDLLVNAASRYVGLLAADQVGAGYEIGVKDPVFDGDTMVGGEIAEISLVDLATHPGAFPVNLVKAGDAALSRTWELPDGSTVTRTWRAQKPCNRCKHLVKIDDFSFDRSAGDGHMATCKSCESEKRQLKRKGAADARDRERAHRGA